jgi:hypothetical protein
MTIDTHPEIHEAIADYIDHDEWEFISAATSHPTHCEYTMDGNEAFVSEGIELSVTVLDKRSETMLTIERTLIPETDPEPEEEPDYLAVDAGDDHSDKECIECGRGFNTVDWQTVGNAGDAHGGMAVLECPRCEEGEAHLYY